MSVELDRQRLKLQLATCRLRKEENDAEILGIENDLAALERIDKPDPEVWERYLRYCDECDKCETGRQVVLDYEVWLKSLEPDETRTA